MVGYATVGTNDKARAGAFYDALLGMLGAKRLMEIEGFVLWGTSFDDACLAVTPPHDGKAASVGNGVMVALRADSKAAVDALHAKALELGGADEGAPGPRGEGFYAGPKFTNIDRFRHINITTCG